MRVLGVPSGSALCERAKVLRPAHPKTTQSRLSGSRTGASDEPKASRAEDPGAASVRTLGAEEHLIGTAAPGDVTSRKGESLRAVNGNACRSVDVRLK